MTVTVNASDRNRIRRAASSAVENPADAASVAIAAFLLLEWVEKAAGDGDREHRLVALHQQRCNMLASRTSSGIMAPVTPESFLDSAQVLYAFSLPGLGEEP